MVKGVDMTAEQRNILLTVEEKEALRQYWKDLGRAKALVRSREEQRGVPGKKKGGKVRGAGMARRKRK